jgi:hypothetical protein
MGPSVKAEWQFSGGHFGSGNKALWEVSEESVYVIGDATQSDLMVVITE